MDKITRKLEDTTTLHFADFIRRLATKDATDPSFRSSLRANFARTVGFEYGGFEYGGFEYGGFPPVMLVRVAHALRQLGVGLPPPY